jgi:hypothetical protein
MSFASLTSLLGAGPVTYIPPVRPPRHPFALDTPTFPFRGLAALAARAPIGGARDVAVAAFTTARMADEVRPGGFSPEERQARAANTRRWITTLTLPEPARRVFLELISATEQDGPATAAALRRVIEVTGLQLDAASRGELERLARDVESQIVGGT